MPRVVKLGLLLEAAVEPIESTSLSYAINTSAAAIKGSLVSLDFDVRQREKRNG